MAKEFRGLTREQVEQSREKFGYNLITPPKKRSVWLLFFDHFKDPIIRILILAATLSLVIAFVDGEFAETIGIFVAIFLATGVAFWFEYDAMKRFDILNTVNDDTLVKTIREGAVEQVPKRDIVVGDTVLVASGDEIPADGPLLRAIAMSVNESTLTGEPLMQKTTDQSQFNPDATYPSNYLLRGTTVMEGNGVMLVEHVGDQTEYGKVAEQSTTESEAPTPLNIQLTRLSKLISKAGIGLAIAIFFILLLKGVFFEDILSSGNILSVVKHVLHYFMISVAIIVMAVPEGLPMSITLSLAMNMRRMLKSNNLVRKMHASETMGAVTVICTDKTGTLTLNQMHVADIKRYADISDELFFEQIAVNSTAFLDCTQNVIGNPTEGALLLWMAERGGEYYQIRQHVRLIDQIPFSTERKYMATIVESSVENKNMFYVKGAPEMILELCDIDDQTKKIAQEQLAEYQNKAMRTLAFAMAPTDKTKCGEAINSGGFTFVGIVGIADPVRDDAPEAVRRCLNAGIEIKIVTGDTPKTAIEIARQIGLWDDAIDGEMAHITGVEFEALSDEQALRRVSKIKIMSRARPLDKQRIVRLLQQLGEIVAVTGDGTNDAPALNFAHVGLSMGSGTSVARQASDITILDDSFTSVSTAVMWGRSLYRNIQRFVMFQLTVNFVALTIVFIGAIFGSELPLTVPQILWVNLIMDTFAAIALASLPPDKNVMNEKPRKPTDFIISKGMVGWIVGIGSIMVIALLSMLKWVYTTPPETREYALSVFFSIFVFMQFWNLFNARVFGTKYPSSVKLRQSKLFILTLIVIAIGQVVIVNFWGDMFRSVPISLSDWLIIIAITSPIAIGGSVYRFIMGKRESSH